MSICLFPIDVWCDELRKKAAVAARLRLNLTEIVHDSASGRWHKLKPKDLVSPQQVGSSIDLGFLKIGELEGAVARHAQNTANAYAIKRKQDSTYAVTYYRI